MDATLVPQHLHTHIHIVKPLDTLDETFFPSYLTKQRDGRTDIMGNGEICDP